MNTRIVLPPEWYPQSAIQLTWPHAETDWSPFISEATNCFIEIAREISKRQKLLVVCKDLLKILFE